MKNTEVLRFCVHVPRIGEDVIDVIGMVASAATTVAFRDSRHNDLVCGSSETFGVELGVGTVIGEREMGVTS